ncbi:uncharacterized protein LOC133359760 [Lethenteron reissneri]|uniref:uncharacterized protein LOC133359760 n=1 Tax=Lethenteron reissneri TaxID=7753 RepID=UPI002AB78C4F|nr:uncharacterized protein LOC133359760 [Lethenteron reissneri]
MPLTRARGGTDQGGEPSGDEPSDGSSCSQSSEGSAHGGAPAIGTEQGGTPGTSGPNNLVPEVGRTLTSSREGGALLHAKVRHVFTGQGTPTWKAFSRNIIGAKELNGWSDAQALRHLTLNLDGRAADFVEALPESAQTQLEELMRRLDLRFGTRNVIRAKTALEARRRQTGEDFRDYAEDVRSLTRIARPEFSKEVIDALAADKLLRYLARTAWWQPKKSSAGLPFDTLVEQALECEELSSERAQLRGSGQEYTVASLIPDEEEDEDEPASPMGRRAREAQKPRETTPGWVAGLQTGMGDIAGRVDRMDGKVTQVGERVTHVGERVTQVREEANKNMKTLQSEMGELRSTVGGLAGRVAQLESDVGQLRTGGGRGSGQGTRYGAAPPPRACYMCDRRGHLVRDCPEITRARQTRGLNSNAP